MAVLNEALAEHAERIGRRAALRDQLDRWDEQFGPVSAKAAREARETLDELDGLRSGEQGVA